MPKKDPIAKTFEESYNIICEKVKEFDDNLAYFKSKEYLEDHVRNDFITPMFMALGWDVKHDNQKNPYKQEVKTEKSQIQEGEINKKFADYAFYLEPDFKNPVFFVEAKKPAVVLENNKIYYLQTHKYGWNAQVPISILTDFEEFIIIDCRSKPDIKYSHNTAVKKFSYKDYLDKEKYKEIYYLFSREAIEDSSISNFVETQIPKIAGKARQGKLFSGAYKAVDDAFLDYIDALRLDLARGFVKKNPNITSVELTEATQKTIDRLVFIRFLEDKQIEYKDHIYNINKWKDFISLSKALDTKYNGVVFKPSIIDSKDFKGIDDGLFMDLCIDISSKESPYNFNAIPIHIIGNIYERFLGKIVVVDNGKVSIELKPEVRKAGGVYYTSKYIVDYLVEKTVGSLIKGKTPKEIDEMTFADISCGSGSFLIGVYEKLIDYHKEYYHAKLDGKTKLTKNSEDYGNVAFIEGNWIITLKRKQDILLNSVFGVDIDSQAVEVTQLSLFLKLLEDESLGTTSMNQHLLFSKVLPDLTGNIKCGNSLVGWDVSSNMGLSDDEEIAVNPFDFRSAFPKVFKKTIKGFNAIVGNPPYVKEGKADQRNFEYVKNSYLADYYQGKMDIWYFFVCNGLDLLKEDGLLGYIAPNNWTTNSGASKLRNKIIRDSQIIEMIDFGNYMVFQDASIQTMNFILKKSNKNPNYSLSYGKLKNQNVTASSIIELLNLKKTKDTIILKPKLSRKNYIDNYILFDDNIHVSLLKKIQNKANFKFDGKQEIAQGIVAPQDSVNKAASKKLVNIPVGTGVFILNNEEKQALNLLEKEEELIKPIYTTNELNRFYADEKHNYWIIYTDSSFKKSDSLNNYPNIKMHLDKFQNIITSDNKPYGLHRARKEDFFKGEKIISLRKCSERPIFSYVNFDSYVTQTFNVIKTKRLNLKYLVALLNSDLIKYWLKHKGKMQGNNFQVDKEPLVEIPIVKTSDNKVLNSLTKLVDDLIEAKKKEHNAITQKDKDFYHRKTINLESQINNTVYDLYELTDDEIKVIEN